MRVLVGVKRVVDYAVKVRVLPDKTAVDLNNVKMATNPFCEIAMEEAIRLKEKKIVSEIIAVSVGPKAAQETLRSALAIGADRSIHVSTDVRTDQEIQPLAIAKILAQIATKEKADMVLVGKQAIDGDNCQTGPMVAALLNWPQCTFASKVEVNDKEVTADRETDTGSEKIGFQIPAVITADLRLNEPRYPSLRNITQAKKKPMEVLQVADLGINVEPTNKVVSVEDPPVRKAGVIVESVDALIDKLKNESGVL